jgi:2-desacetyl-2-hydroxyethyl bacteriochlorophyllide A dehydrogenase
VLEDRALPEPGVGEVSLKTLFTLISIGTELTALSGDYPEGSVWEACFPYPHTPGYNNIGIVTDICDGVDQNLIGKKYASWGNHAAFTVQKVHELYPVDDEVPDEQAVFFTIGQIVMNSIRRSKIIWGESAVVYGAGLLGQLAAVFCRLSGAKPVFVVDPADFRLKVLPEDPGIIRVNPKRDDIVSVVKKHTKGRMADVVFEVTGRADLIPGELEPLHEQGRFVLLSSPHDKTLFDFHDLCNRPSFTIIGAHNFSHPVHETVQTPWTMKRHAEQFFDLLASGEVDAGRMISRKVGYKEAPAVYEQLLGDRSKDLGIVIEWGEA